MYNSFNGCNFNTYISFDNDQNYIIDKILVNMIMGLNNH